MAGGELETIHGPHEIRCGKGVFDDHDRNVGANQRGCKIFDTAPPAPAPAALVAVLVLAVGVFARRDEDDHQAASFDVGGDALHRLAEHDLGDLLPPLCVGSWSVVGGRGVCIDLLRHRLTLAVINRLSPDVLKGIRGRLAVARHLCLLPQQRRRL